MSEGGSSNDARGRDRQRVAGLTVDLDSETLEAIRRVKPGRRSREAERRLRQA